MLSVERMNIRRVLAVLAFTGTTLQTKWACTPGYTNRNAQHARIPSVQKDCTGTELAARMIWETIMNTFAVPLHHRRFLQILTFTLFMQFSRGASCFLL